MIYSLGQATLKSGESMQIERVTAPEDSYASRVNPFLAHKGPPWEFHLESAFGGETDGLETHFYLGVVGEQIYCNIMTVEFRGCGILGHVFTAPQHRRKGAASLVMERQMEDFRQRGGTILYLGTGFDTPPFHIYESFGFRGLAPGSGLMEYLTHDAALRDHFSTAPVHVEEALWGHWPLVNALTIQVEGEHLRNLAFGCFGFTSFEGTYVSLKSRQLGGGEDLQAKVLMTDRDAVVGLATLVPDPRWRGVVKLLDVYVHRNFAAATKLLLESLDYPDGKIQTFIDSEAEQKRTALLAAGFTVEAELHNQTLVDGVPKDIIVLSRGGYNERTN